jgi:hypothetical protein
MLQWVAVFSRQHGVLFPENSLGRELLNTIHSVLEELGALIALRTSSIAATKRSRRSGDAPEGSACGGSWEGITEGESARARRVRILSSELREQPF